MTNQYDFEPDDQGPTGAPVAYGFMAIFIVAIIAVCLWATHRAKPSIPERVLSPVEHAWATVDTARPDMRCNAERARWYNDDGMACLINHHYRMRAPLGTKLLIRNPLNRKCAEVVVCGYLGTYGNKAFISLSPTAAESLDMVRSGVLPVEVWCVNEPR